MITHSVSENHLKLVPNSQNAVNTHNQFPNLRFVSMKAKGWKSIGISTLKLVQNLSNLMKKTSNYQSSIPLELLLGGGFVVLQGLMFCKPPLIVE